MKFSGTGDGSMRFFRISGFKRLKQSYKLAVATVFASVLMASGIHSTEALADNSGSANYRNSTVLPRAGRYLKKHAKKTKMMPGISAIYLRQETLPKTGRFAKPQVTTTKVYGQAAWVCSPSGFGRRATCAART
jgi:hypothetical protein